MHPRLEHISKWVAMTTTKTTFVTNRLLDNPQTINIDRGQPSSHQTYFKEGMMIPYIVMSHRMAIFKLFGHITN